MLVSEHWQDSAHLASVRFEGSSPRNIWNFWYDGGVSVARFSQEDNIVIFAIFCYSIVPCDSLGLADGNCWCPGRNAGAFLWHLAGK